MCSFKWTFVRDSRDVLSNKSSTELSTYLSHLAVSKVKPHLNVENLACPQCPNKHSHMVGLQFIYLAFHCFKMFHYFNVTLFM